MAGRAVPRPEAAPRHAEMPRERRKATDRARALPAIAPLVHRAPAQQDHRGARRRVAAGEGGDAVGGHPGDGRRPLGAEAADVRGERVEADGVAGHELRVVKPLPDDDRHHRQGERGVGPGPDQDHLVGLRRGLGLAHVDRDDVGPAATGGGQVRTGVRLAGEVGAPQHDEARVRAHVLLRVRLEGARQSEAEAAQPPADHRGMPPLAAPEIREAPEEVGADPRPVVVREEPVPRPEPDRLAAGFAHPGGDHVERLVPADPAPGVLSPARADERMEEPARVVDDLARRLAPDAEESAAVRVVRIAPHAQEAPALDGDQHAAERRVAVHGAHGADRARAARRRAHWPAVY